jgi:hypothetical protein
MKRNSRNVTLLQIPLLAENYNRSAIASLSIHGILLLLVLFGGRLFPQTVLKLGSGPGGGAGGDITTVGVVEELSGGAGMVKPAMVPKPPVLEKESVEENEKAIPMPGSLDTKKKKEIAKNDKKIKTDMRNIIPTSAEPGSGGIAGNRGGTGGGSGGGNGVSIGSGSGGIGDHWYARVVESKISSNWRKPLNGMHIEMTYSFYIADNGRIYGIKQEKSSGYAGIDLTAQQAILGSDPLAPPPPDIRGKKIQFVAQFIYPQVP